MTRTASPQEVTRRLDQGDTEATWSARLTEDGGIHFERLWRGVTDHHVVDLAFLNSAEARKLHRVAGEFADVYLNPSRLVKASSAAASTAETGEGS